MMQVYAWKKMIFLIEISKNLATDLKIILLDHQNNYVERLNVDDKVAKSFNILSISLNVLLNY